MGGGSQRVLGGRANQGVFKRSLGVLLYGAQGYSQTHPLTRGRTHAPRNARAHKRTHAHTLSPSPSLAFSGERETYISTRSQARSHARARARAHTNCIYPSRSAVFIDRPRRADGHVCFRGRQSLAHVPQAPRGAALRTTRRGLPEVCTRP